MPHKRNTYNIIQPWSIMDEKYDAIMDDKYDLLRRKQN